jgi:hypothetical protein
MHINLRNPHIGVAVGLAFMLVARIVVGGDASDVELRTIGVATFLITIGVALVLVLREESRRDKLKR